MHKKIRLICALLCFLYLALSSALTPALPASEAPPSTQQAVLEAKLNAEKEIRQKDQEKIEVQIQGFDKRIESFESHLANISALLIALLATFGVGGYFTVNRRASKEAKESADQWFKGQGATLQSEIEGLKVEAAKKVSKLVENAEKEIADAVKKAQPATEELQKQTDKEADQVPLAQVDNAALAQADKLLRHKPEADYSVDDWNTRAFNAANQKDWTAAVMYWTGAARVQGANDLQIAQAMINKGAALGELNQHEDAIGAYGEVIKHFGAVPEPELQVRVARAMFNKGLALGKLNQHENAIRVYDKVIKCFNKATEPEFREAVARAMSSKGVAFSKLEQHKNAIGAYDEVIEHFNKATEPELQVRVARAMLNKGVDLGELNRHGEVIAAYDKLILDFGEASEPELQKIVAEAKLRSSELSSLNPAAKEGE